MKKLFYYILLFLLSLLIIFLILFAMNNKINLFYSPEEILQNDSFLYNKEIKVGGIVKAGSIKVYKDLNFSFIITDYKHDINVNYRGLLPDLFHEHQGLVVQGILINNNTLNANQVLAKHDEKYIPIKMKHK